MSAGAYNRGVRLTPRELAEECEPWFLAGLHEWFRQYDEAEKAARKT